MKVSIHLPTLLIILFPYASLCQYLNNSLWQNGTEEYIYYLFVDNKLFEITDYRDTDYPDVTIEKRFYGFHDKCEINHLDSLHESGQFYLEVWNSDRDSTTYTIDDSMCLEYSFSQDGSIVTFYNSSRQQFFHYIKRSELPDSLQQYLSETRPKVYNEYLRVIR